MRRVLLAISLLALGGCGSCAEEKKVEPVEQATAPVETVTSPDGGRTFVVGKSQYAGVRELLRRLDGGLLEAGVDAGR